MPWICTRRPANRVSTIVTVSDTAAMRRPGSPRRMVIRRRRFGRGGLGGAGGGRSGGEDFRGRPSERRGESPGRPCLLPEYGGRAVGSPALGAAFLPGRGRRDAWSRG